MSDLPNEPSTSPEPVVEFNIDPAATPAPPASNQAQQRQRASQLAGLTQRAAKSRDRTSRRY